VTTNWAAERMNQGPVRYFGVVADPTDCLRCGLHQRTHDNAEVMADVGPHEYVEPPEDVIKARMQARRSKRIADEKETWWLRVLKETTKEFDS
jgi:hypothetical protein